MTDTVLAVDLGTSRLRSGLFNRKGQCLAVAAREYPIEHPVPGAAEQDPLRWKRAFFDTVHEILQESGTTKVEGLSFSGQMHGTVLLGEDGQPTRNAIIWCDQRGGPACKWIFDRIDKAEYGRLTGNPLATGFQTATLAYLRESEPDEYKRIHKVLLPKDYLLHELTSQCVSEPSDAVSTGLLDLGLRGKAEKKWSEKILELLEIDSSRFPALVPSLGPDLCISDETAKQTGLPTGLPVLALGGDAVMGANIALGENRDGDAIGLISSGGQLLVSRDRPFPEPERGVHLLPQLAPNRWLSMAAFLAAGLSLDWFAKSVGGMANGPVEIEPLLEEAEKVPAGSDGLCFLPHISGERTPYLDPSARGVFWGIASTHGIGHLARAVLEGVAFSFRLGLDILMESGGPIRSMTLGGGGAKSPLWCQIFADALNREVRTVTDIGETSLVGAAYAASQVLSWEKKPWLPQTVQVYQPSQENAKILNGNYGQFVEVAPELRRIRQAKSGDLGR